MAVRGLPMVRQGERWANHPGVNADLPPFGMSLAEADAIAEAVSPADLVAYQADVTAALLACLAALDENELDRVPDLDRHCRLLPAHLHTPGYLEEVGDMAGWNIARFFSSPCIGHARGHLGELDLAKTMLRT